MHRNGTSWRYQFVDRILTTYSTRLNLSIRTCVHVVDLVTFYSNKYLTVEGVKAGSGNWKSEMGSTQQTSNVFSIFCQSVKKVYFHPFLSCFCVHFGVLCVNIGGFESFHQYGACSSPEKHKFQTKLDVENFRSLLLWSENVVSVSVTSVNLTY